MASSDTQKQTQLLIDTNEKILSNVKCRSFSQPDLNLNPLNRKQ